jgi:hypothetical protein
MPPRVAGVSDGGTNASSPNNSDFAHINLGDIF